MGKETNWNNLSYTKEQFIDAWNTSSSKAQVLSKLGLNKSGSAYVIIKRVSLELQLDAGHLVNYQDGSRRLYAFDEVFVKNSPIIANGTSLRIKLVKAGIKEDKCEKCGNTEWMGEPIPLSLDHINGDNKDNRIENLRVLCLNCHGQTETWCGRNKIRKTSSGSYPGENLKTYFCKCGNPVSGKNNERCLECFKSLQASKYPPVEELLLKVKSSSYEAVGREYNVSGNAIRKFIKRRMPEGFNMNRYSL